jgi:hypothetical protein
MLNKIGHDKILDLNEIHFMTEAEIYFSHKTEPPMSSKSHGKE